MSNLRNIPGVDEVLLQDEIQQILLTYNREFVVKKIRESINELRNELQRTETQHDKEALTNIVVLKVTNKVREKAEGTLKRVINATGVVLHTNLGRAPLDTEAITNLVALTTGYNNLELDLTTGERGSRYDHVEDLLLELTGAEAALVVNNNAAAVLLGLNTLAKNKEVIVSRGQLVEVGGAFRIPDVMRQSGANLIEVGTTNKTYISDFNNAVNEETALFFTAHTSNYKIVGFSEEVDLKDLVDLGKKSGIAVMQDLGSGIMYKLDNWGLAEEPTVKECVEAGVDIITFSGDKLLGGPQAGIIVGKKELVQKMKKNQLTRALRVDKLTIAMLEATLKEYLKKTPQENIPVLRMLTYNEDDLKLKAEALYEVIQKRLRNNQYIAKINIVELEDMVGGGAYPTYKLTGWGVEIEFKEIHLEKIAKRLRMREPAIITRRQDGKLLLSARTILNEEKEIAEAISKALQG
ncbi:L-seryl-tRNA(Sec) selenium transferase [Candidatus Syntrophocurvum alkaliphilum]|uniref:L-seryl-tRNA(Sec) selenium transferase n=1 Tax=Candidatus Syntrophocurvum alkaliphilum TaxID=2293317 RepID=A0A6I6DJ04_9FIRM|nr:L-seryl-tRNA(Sec) selenium transferase [Candidatus Syntrophocurvum alkaliphilum]QGU00629.1 L-seryl-tRNA(Sec) selenium transferase [Candidatus Syntrophocurvum alkaliphilum]